MPLSWPALRFASRLHVGLMLLGVTVMPASAIDFPDPSQLKSNPELPDPLTTFAGKKVASKEDWEKVRRPELKQLFQHYMYGQYPTVKPKVSGKVLFEDTQAFDGKATLREVALTMAEGAPPVHVLIAVPNKLVGAFPVFVGLNFSGNHTLTDHPKVRVATEWMYPNQAGATKDGKASADGRNKAPNTWPLDLILSRGYAVVTAYNGEIIPDNFKIRGGLADAVMPVAAGKQAPDATATIMAWAWGIHRMVDYIETQSYLDAKRVTVVGHSRLGKTALLATAFDDRIAIGIPHQAGCGGTGPSRSKNPKAETVKRITTSFPHWFCENFAQFGDDTTKLPFDQHCLAAVCAPRPLLFSNANDDQWANPPGQFDILTAATPVYKLLGVEGLKAEKQPAVGTMIDSRLGFWERPGKHETNREDWGMFLNFADKWLK